VTRITKPSAKTLGFHYAVHMHTSTLFSCSSSSSSINRVVVVEVVEVVVVVLVVVVVVVVLGFYKDVSNAALTA
jgi:hypothetical protein